METEHIVLRYLLETAAGAAMGITLLGQYYIGVATQKSAISGSTKEKFIAFSIRIAAAIFSFLVIALVAGVVGRSNPTLLDALALAAGAAIALLLGRKKIIKDKKNRK